MPLTRVKSRSILLRYLSLCKILTSNYSLNKNKHQIFFFTTYYLYCIICTICNCYIVLLKRKVKVLKQKLQLIENSDILFCKN